MTPARFTLRTARPGDYDTIAAVVDTWWGRPVLPSLPRIFLDLFWATSLVAEDVAEDVAADGGASLAGFLVGVLSPSDPDEAYVHFVGVAPAARGHGLGRALHARFAAMAVADGRRVVRAVTSPLNATSIAFHRAAGFSVDGPVQGHNGPGTSRMLFTRALEADDAAPTTSPAS